MSEDDLVRRLQVGHDSGCAMSYGMHEHCCDCSYPDRQESAETILKLRQDLAAARALLREARDFTPGAWITGGATSLRQRIDTALFKDFAETKRARDLAYMNGYEVAKEEYRELLHKAEADLAAARAERNAAQMDAAKTGEREAVYLSRIQHLMSELEAARALLQSLRSLVPEAYRHHITAALAGEKK